MENKFIRLVSTALNVMSTELLRVHSQQDGTISPEKVTATIGLAGTASPVFSLHEEVLVKIFGFLSLKDLLRVSRVCRWWYRLSFDGFLWKSVDLNRFASRLTDPVKMQLLISKRFSNKIQCLDLSGFTLSEGTLHILASSCKQLRALKLKSVTFTTDTNRSIQLENLEGIALFPGNLNYLDIRFSHGNPRVYRAIASSLTNIKRLGLCDAFLYTLLKDDTLETTIESMKSLRKLDLSHCRLLKDSTLALFARCSKLEVLSVRKCPMLTGRSVHEFLESCTQLRTLILDGISIEDETLQSIRWDSSLLTHLELGWCPLITPIGLKSTLPRVAKIPTLEYLGLCSIGGGKALNDEILLEMAASSLKRRYNKLSSLNLSCSLYITLDGLESLYPFVKALDIANCPDVKGFPMKYDKNNNTVPDAGKTSNRKNMSSHFSRFEWSLETPL